MTLRLANMYVWVHGRNWNILAARIVCSCERIACSTHEIEKSERTGACGAPTHENIYSNTSSLRRTRKLCFASFVVSSRLAPHLLRQAHLGALTPSGAILLACVSCLPGLALVRSVLPTCRNPPAPLPTREGRVEHGVSAGIQILQALLGAGVFAYFACL